MLYHGLQIALSTNRKLYVDRSRFDPLELPRVITNAKDAMHGEELRADHQFVCADVSSRHPKLFLQDASWPQALYIHPTIGPWLRKNFGYHAAYFMGNYLFGTNKIKQNCRSDGSAVAVEGFGWPRDREMLPLSHFKTVVGRCGVDLSENVFVVNSEETSRKWAKEVVQIDTSSVKSQVCALRRLMAVKRIVHTFGSRLGFCATAMQGRAGGFVNSIDNICVNMSNSQQGEAGVHLPDKLKIVRMRAG
jgi:hypothetical protein